MYIGLEYNLDSVGCVAYDETTFNAIDFSGNHTLLVRIAATPTTSASKITTLTFSTNPIV